MKIGVFAYNFNHWKTQAGIQNLILGGKKPEVVFCAPRVDLKFYRSKIRVSPKDLFLFHPHQICDYHDIDYHVAPHNSDHVANLISKYDLDLGIILGARILDPLVINRFNKGVLNMHPGILPENRGLDTIKWAIINNISQGVTTHLIDGKIDRGLLVEKRKIEIYSDDTLLDLQIRLQNLEQEMMLSSIKILQSQDVEGLKKIEKGIYNSSMPPDIESQLMKKFLEYKECHK